MFFGLATTLGRRQEKDILLRRQCDAHCHLSEPDSVAQTIAVTQLEVSCLCFFLCCKLFGARAHSQYICTVLIVRSTLVGHLPGAGVIYNNGIVQINLRLASFLSQIQVFVNSSPSLGIFSPPMM